LRLVRGVKVLVAIGLELGSLLPDYGVVVLDESYGDLGLDHHRQRASLWGDVRVDRENHVCGQRGPRFGRMRVAVSG
jgi:hypothetical protein